MKKLGLILGVVLVLGLAFLIFAVTVFFHPDYLKPVITARIEKHTGCHLIMDEPLSFSILPALGVKVPHMQLTTANASLIPFVQVEARNAIIGLKWRALLRGKFETGFLQLDQLTFNQKDKSETLQLNHLSLQSTATSPLSNTLFTKLSFQYSENEVPLTGNAEISGDVIIDWREDSLLIHNMNLTTSLAHNNEKYQLTTTGDMLVDVRHQTLAWHHFNASIADLVMKGELTADKILSHPDLVGHLDMQVSHASPTMLAASGLDNIHLNLHFNNDILHLTSIKADLLGGSLDGSMIIAMEAFLPDITAHFKAYNIQLNPLFKLLKGGNAVIQPDTEVTGSGNIEFDVTASGRDEKSLLSSLNGLGHADITNGTVTGKDWDDIVAKLAMANPAFIEERVSQGFRLFRFKRLSSSFKIHNGIFAAEDIVIKSLDTEINGKASINFVRNQMDYELKLDGVGSGSGYG